MPTYCGYQFHPQPSPPGQTPGTPLKRGKNSTPGAINVYKCYARLLRHHAK